MKGTFLQGPAEAVTKVSKWVFKVSNIIALLLMLTIFVDVFFRRLNVSVTGAMDLIEVFFCMLCFLCFSYAWVKGDHINVEILLEHLSPKIQKIIRLFSATIGIFIFACLTYGGFKLAFASFRFGDVTVDLGFPRGIPQSVIVIGALLFLLQLIVTVLFELGIIRKPDQYN